VSVIAPISTNLQRATRFTDCSTSYRLWRRSRGGEETRGRGGEETKRPGGQGSKEARRRGDEETRGRGGEETTCHVFL